MVISFLVFSSPRSLVASATALLRVLDGDFVLGLFLTAQLGGLGDGLAQFGDGGGEVGQFFGQLGDGGLQLVDFGVEGFDLGSLFLTRGFVGGQFGVAPSLVFGFFVGFFHEAHDQVLNQLLHLLERIGGGIGAGLHGELRQDTRVQLLRLTLQEAGHFGDALVLVHDSGRATKLDQSGLLFLHQGRQVLVGGARHGTGAQDFHGLFDGGELVGAQLLAVLEVGCLLRAGGGQVGQVLGVIIASGGGVSQVALGVGGSLQLLAAGGSLVGAGLGVVLDLSGQVLHQHVVGVTRVGLGLFEVGALVVELVLQLFQHLNDAAALELVRVRFRRARVQAHFRVLSEKGRDNLLAFLRDQ